MPTLTHYLLLSAVLFAIGTAGVFVRRNLITILQSILAFLILNNMRFAFWEAGLLLVLWVAQFLRPSLRDEICWIYGTWAFFILVTGVADRSGFRAPRLFMELFRVHFRSPPRPEG